MKIVTTLMISVLAGSLAIAATPASAQWRGQERHHSNNTGAIIGAGILGLAVGAVVASRSAPSTPYYGAPYAIEVESYGPPMVRECRVVSDGWRQWRECRLVPDRNSPLSVPRFAGLGDVASGNVTYDQYGRLVRSY